MFCGCGRLTGVTERSFTAYGVTNVQGPARPLPTGAMFPASADVLLLDIEDVSTVVTLSLRCLDGHPALVGVAVGTLPGDLPVELSASYLHDLPVARLTEIAVHAVAASFADPRAGAWRGDPEQAAAAALRARRRHAMTDELLKDVAQIVRSHPDAPTAAVQDLMHVSYRTAGRWVAEARGRGFLPPVSRKARQSS